MSVHSWANSVSGSAFLLRCFAFCKVIKIFFTAYCRVCVCMLQSYFLCVCVRLVQGDQYSAGKSNVPVVRFLQAVFCILDAIFTHKQCAIFDKTIRRKQQQLKRRSAPICKSHSKIYSSVCFCGLYVD